MTLFGFSMLFLSLAASFVAFFQAVVALRGRKAAMGVRWFRISAVAGFAAAAYLLYLLLTNCFDYAYVWSYSSVSLPFIYKVSAFWAGQEGSFLLWLLLHFLCGLFLCCKRRMGAGAFAVFLFVQILLLSLLLAKSPFMLMAEPQADGAGLNPLLQDPWMAIHPPLIFIGYAMLAIPYCYLIGAMLEREYRTWLRPALLWTLGAWTFLGAGIFIGGYWAYMVLGWGGYWGWDPVENASLIPWLSACISLHLLRSSLVQDGAIRLSCFAVAASFVLVLYGAFLTRSGILRDFSVHSFSGDGIGVFLALSVAAMAAAAFFALAVRWPELPVGTLYDSVTSRRFLFYVSMALLTLVTSLVLLGTSMPLFGELAGKAQSVSPSYYNRVLQLPAALLLALLAAATAASRLLWGVGTIGAMLFYFFVAPMMLIAAAAGAGMAAVAALFLAMRRGDVSLATFLAHGGIVILLLGVFFSSAGGKTEIISFSKGEVKLAAGHAIRYLGVEIDADAGRKVHLFENDGEQATALTKLNTRGMDAARAPAVLHLAAGDLYIAPASGLPDTAETLLERHKPTMTGNLLLRLQGVMEEAVPELSGSKMLRAVIEVSDGVAVEEVSPVLAPSVDGYHSIPVSVFGGKYRLTLTAVSGDGKAVRVRAVDVAEENHRPVQAEVGWKPLIWFVWLGATAICLGGGMAVRAHRRGSFLREK